MPSRSAIIVSLFLAVVLVLIVPLLIGNADPPTEVISTLPSTVAVPSEATAAVESASVAPPPHLSAARDSDHPTNTEPSASVLCPDPQPLSDEALSTARYITFDPPGEQFGLTNQLITLAGAMHLGLRWGRIVVLPGNATLALWPLIDVRETLKYFPCTFSIVNYDRVKLVDEQGKKFKRLHFGGRVFNVEHPHLSLKMIDRQAKKLESSRGMRLSTVMWHVPYTEKDLLHLTEHYILRHIVLSKTHIRDKAARILSAIGYPSVPFVGLHLRLEKDIALFRMDRPVLRPSNERLKELVTNCLQQAVQLAVKRKQGPKAAPRVLYVSAGASLPKDVQELLKSLSPVTYDRVLFKWDIVPVDTSWDKRSNITNHYEAGVDLEIMVKSAVAISADFSTFARAIQFARCEPRQLKKKLPTLNKVNSQCGDQKAAEEETAPALFTYDQQFGALSPRWCCDPPTGGLESTPFASTLYYRESTQPMCRASG